MSVVPVVMGIGAILLLRNIVLDSWISLGAAIALFLVIYIPLFFMFSMNQSERDLFIKPIKSIIHKIKR